MARPRVCGSCGASVVWATTADGKRMPLDAEPSEKSGNLVRELGNDGWTVRAARADERTLQLGMFAPATRLYTSHFATCPNAADHRKPRARRKAVA